MHGNHLIRETSPYLRQHARNPVEWYPWGRDALDRAEAEDRPIFLSIGYSACHWCHVMAHESFEDPETAATLNARFVCIKVDREERPDLDALYMRSVALLTGSGGWPLSVFLTPGRKPFYGGTYFPKEARWGMASFRQVLEGVAKAYQGKREEIEQSADQVLAEVGRSFAGITPAGPIGTEAAGRALDSLLARFDPAEGGFGAGPKFPQPPLLGFLLDEAARRDDRALSDQVLFTLRKMEAGGVRDQMGGGFHRYSVDGQWRVPHYEKMLYDNAQLASLYFRAFALAGDHDLLTVGRAILSDMEGAMAAPGGGFVAALDADSEGEEGKFYLWTPGELEAVLGPEEAKIVARAYGIGPGRGLEERTLHRTASWHELARRAREPEPACRGRMDADLDRLRAAREKRVRPGVDTKVLTDWNALAAKAFLDGYAAGHDPKDLKTGLETLSLLWKRCWNGEGLSHVWDGQRAKVPGFLSDHATLALAEWRAFEVTGDPGHLDRVERLAGIMRTRFRDPGAGCFVDAAVSGGAEGLLIPVRDTEDGVLPSPVSTLARVLWNWERLTGDGPVRTALDDLLLSESGDLRANPGAHPLLAEIAAGRSRPPVDVVVAAPAAAEADDLLKAARSPSAPQVLVLPLLADRCFEERANRYPLFEGRWSQGAPAAYICAGGACKRPVSDPAAVQRLIEEALKVPPSGVRYRFRVKR